MDSLVTIEADELKMSGKYGFSTGISKDFKGRKIVEIVRVEAGGVAEQSGVQVGSRLLAVNGKPVDSKSSTEMLTGAKAAGEDVILCLQSQEHWKFPPPTHYNPDATVSSALLYWMKTGPKR